MNSAAFMHWGGCWKRYCE